MPIHVLVLALAGLFPGVEPPADPVLQGMVVNASRGGVPAADVEVVLRAGRDNQFRHLASTRTDEKGHFVFDRRQLVAAPELVYIAGANWDGIHYPGPRLQFDPRGAPVTVQITVHDTVASPSPLVADTHEIQMRARDGVVEVTEILVVDNPTATTYVGAVNPGMAMKIPITLVLTVPEGVSHVTFNKEFDGRNFQLIDGHMVTSVPWPPGKRQLAFMYRLPAEHNELVFERSLDLPCKQARIAVSGQGSEEVTCSLPRVTAPGQVPVGFESAGQPLPAGTPLRLEMRQLPVSWIVYGRWAAILLLAGFLGVTAIRLAWRRSANGEQLVGSASRKGNSRRR